MDRRSYEPSTYSLETSLETSDYDWNSCSTNDSNTSASSGNMSMDSSWCLDKEVSIEETQPSKGQTLITDFFKVIKWHVNFEE